MKQHLYNILFVCAGLLGTKQVNAQIANAIPESNETVTTLNTVQSETYSKIIKSKSWQGITIIKTPHILDGIGEGKLMASHPALPCDNLTFSIAGYDFADSNDYAWYGYMEDDDDLDCTQGRLQILCHDGKIIGSLSTDGFYANLYDLGDGLTALCIENAADEQVVACHVPYNPVAQRGTGTDPCSNVKTKVLVLYTPAGANANSDIPGTVMAGIQNLNYIWASSQVNNTISLAGIVPVNLTETQNSSNDVRDWSLMPNIQALRDQYKAEIVVFFTGNYDGVFGQAKQVGGSKPDAYCIIESAEANNRHHTFAHEICHLFGCGHDGDNAVPGYAHGNVFTTGWLIFTKKRYTLMAQATSNKDKLEYLSSPDLSFKGVALGDATYKNNAQRVRDAKDWVADYYSDGSLPISTAITVSSGGQCVQYGYAKAGVQCGIAPYRYEWQYSENGTNWYPYGTTQGINYSVPLPPNNLTYNSALLRVKVTDAAGSTATGTVRVTYSCPHHNNPHGGPGGLNRGINATTGNSGAQGGISISPNPSTGILDLNLAVEQEQSISLFLCDMQGHIIQAEEMGMVAAQAVAYRMTITDHITNGLYMLQIKGSKGFQKNEKITLKR